MKPRYASWRGRPALLVAATVVGLALLLEVVLIARGGGVSLRGFAPYWSDEVDYWRQIGTFADRTFSGGYYGWNEEPAGASWSHFGTHGPAPAVLLGIPARLFGWSLTSPLYLNFAALGLALAVAFAAQRRLAIAGTLACGVFLLVNWPLVLYIPTAMLEPVNQALGIAIGGLTAAAVRRRPAPPSPRLLVALTTTIVVAGVLRPTWGFLLLLPVLLVPVAPRRRLALAGIAASAMIALFAFSTWTWASYPFGFQTQLRDTPTTTGKLDLLIDHSVDNVGRFFDPQVSSTSSTLEIANRYEIAGLLVLAVIAFAVARRRRRKLDDSQAETERSGTIGALAFVILAPVVLAVVVGYDVFDFRDFRTLAPHLTATVVLASLAGGRRELATVAVLTVTNLALVGQFGDMATRFREGHFERDPVVAQSSAALRSALSARDRSSDPWCRTVLWAEYAHMDVQLGAPRSYGFMLADSVDDVDGRLRSGYVLLTEAETGKAARLNLEPLVALPPAGVLYRNNRADCG